ncbi:hypothetical protein JCM17380_31480 [Desulfosporosinus burensis]
MNDTKNRVPVCFQRFYNDIVPFVISGYVDSLSYAGKYFCRHSAYGDTLSYVDRYFFRDGDSGDYLTEIDVSEVPS